MSKTDSLSFYGLITGEENGDRKRNIHFPIGAERIVKYIEIPVSRHLKMLIPVIQN